MCAQQTDVWQTDSLKSRETKHFSFKKINFKESNVCQISLKISVITFGIKLITDNTLIEANTFNWFPNGWSNVYKKL